MGLVQTINFSDFSSHKLLRFDFKYLNYQTNKKNVTNFIKVKDCITSYFKGFAFKSENFKDDGNVYVLKGDLFNDDFSINFDKIQYLDDIFFNTHNKFKLNQNDIVVSLVGSIGKMVIIDDNYNMLLNQNNISLQVNNKLFYNKFFAYILRYEINDLVNNIYNNSGYSFLSIDDLFNLQIPNINLTTQKKAIKQIEPIEQEIQNLKSQKKEHLEIINDVFSEEFKIDLEEIKKLDHTKQFSLKLHCISLKNDLLRTSFKWHKLEKIQSYMYKNINCIQKLSQYILNTNNGWSPQSNDIDDGTPILGQEHILKNGKISLEASKFTQITKNNIENFYVKQNDFFVSRGNTLDLVALAGVVKSEVDKDIIYPDLYIKIDFDNSIYKEYMAYIFNSFIGRIYFKHVAKGKNQTMVKVSSKELNDFYLPIPTKEIQQQIVDKIKTKIDTQKEIDIQIEQKQKQIGKIIEDCIKGKS